MMDSAQEQIDDLIGRLRSEEAWEREKAACALARMGVRAVPKLLAALQNADWIIRRQTALVFVKAPNARAVPSLCELAGDSDWEVRVTAVAALRAAADPRSAAALLRRLDDVHPKVRALAAEALLVMDEANALTSEHLGDHVSFTRTTSGIEDPDPRVRRAAALALGLLGDARAIQWLAPILVSDDHLVAAEAAKALGRLAAPDALEPLWQVVRDSSNVRVQAAACRALGAISGEVAIAALTVALRARATEVRRTAALELSRLARESPQVALLSAVPNLRRRLSQGRWFGDDDAAIYADAIRSIERATRALRDLPVPSGGGTAAGWLPVPAAEERTASSEHRITSHLTAAFRGRRSAAGFLQRLRARLRSDRGPGQPD